jgi:large subunit ribosomal protein L3
MTTMLLGKKIGMTQIYNDKGVIVPVTVIQAGPCTVLQVKTPETDGYCALQLGYDDIKASRQKKPLVGHAAKAGQKPKRFIREVRLAGTPEQKAGDQLTVELFQNIKYVDVVGTSKGKGYAGVMKRHNFKGMPASHGTERKHRCSGGIGANAGGRGTARSIKKGKRMAGHLGHVRSTSRNHLVVGVDQENNLLLVKGSIAGPNNGYVMVAKAKTKN